MRRFAFVLALALLTSACWGTARGSFGRTLPVSGRTDLQVDTGSGDVTVRTGPPGQVTVLGRIAASFLFFGPTGESRVRSVEKNPPIRQTGTEIHLERTSEWNVAIDYEITV